MTSCWTADPSSPGTAWLIPDDVVRDIKRARAKADLVLPFLHWGEELVEVESPDQKELAHRFIDAGAFVFDHFPHDPPVWKGWIVRLSFGATGRPQLKTTEVELDPAGIPHLMPQETRGLVSRGASS